MHALIENGTVKQYPYSTGDLKRANPQTSFPSQISDASLLEYGVHRVFFATQPEVTATQVLEEGTPVFSTEDQRWTQTFAVRDMSAEEAASRNDAQAAQVRAERNSKLAKTDWRFRSDLTPTQQWIDYCQALRDVTAQVEFPWSVQWPTQPE
jgi:hypothetical protein